MRSKPTVERNRGEKSRVRIAISSSEQHGSTKQPKPPGGLRRIRRRIAPSELQEPGGPSQRRRLEPRIRPPKSHAGHSRGRGEAMASAIRAMLRDVILAHNLERLRDQPRAATR